MSNRRRILKGFLAAGCATFVSSAYASYGQMRLSFGVFAMVPGAVLALPFALAEWIGSRLSGMRSWALVVGSGSLVTGLAWRVSDPALNERQFGGQPALLGATFALAMLLAWLPSRELRVGLISAAAITWKFAILADTPRSDDAEWLLLGFALTWALLSFLRGNRSQVDEQSEQANPVDGRQGFRLTARPPKLTRTPVDVRQGLKLTARPPKLTRTLDTFVSTATGWGQHLAGLLQDSTSLVSGVLVFFVCYGGGAALVAYGLEPISTILLSIAGTLPGSAEPPINDPAAAFAYWISHGILPVLLVSILFAFLRSRKSH